MNPHTSSPSSKMRNILALPLITLILYALSGCQSLTSVRIWGPVDKPPTEALKVETLRDVVYYDGAKGDTARHSLDVYVPKGKKDYPVIVLIHGGAWMMGDKNCCGLYPTVAEYFTSRGIGVVLPNYRLSPSVKHPEHVKDVARAVAWTRKHIAEHGGSPDKIFLAGHSAGGHLVALLATDETYLKREGMQVKDIKGVISICGVYRIPSGKMELTLGGDTERAFRLSEITPLRGSSETKPTGIPGIPLFLDVFGPAFGDDPKFREAASPINHVRPGLPPFLIISAENDLPTLAKMAEEFDRALQEQKCESHLMRVPNRNHNSTMFKAIQDDDPAAKAMVEFVRSHCNG